MLNYSVSIQADYDVATLKLDRRLMYNPFTSTTSLSVDGGEKNVSSKVIKIQWARVVSTHSV